jgi:glutamate synthase (NADPH/NADH) small chain
MSEMSNKERMKISRQHMPEQDPNVRNSNFLEVNLGLANEIAMLEADRCIQCKNPHCIEGCPVHVKIPEFIKAIADGKFKEAAQILKEDNALPAVCGRVCPQEEQCEKVCIIGNKGIPVAIGNLERFAADWERINSKPELPVLPPKTGYRIAIVGGGPAGLSCAGDLIRMGHDVTVFEALHDIGGVLLYGIPEFRLPKEIVNAEVSFLEQLGVKFVKNFVVGLTQTIDELLDENESDHYDAIFIGVGAGLPYFLNIKGEHLNGVYSANEYLTRINLMKAYQFPNNDTPIMDLRGKKVAVFGGGNTAMDAIRTSKRLGAEKVYILYRRTEKEMPARIEEIKHAKEEGVEFLFLNAPLEFTGTEDGWLKSVIIQRMELGEPDSSGRRRPVPIEGAIEEILIDTAVIAIGNGSNPIINQTTPDLKVNKWGNITVNLENMKTSKKAVFAGGDIVTGGATVILAMGAGRTAAKAINEYLYDQETW